MVIAIEVAADEIGVEWIFLLREVGILSVKYEVVVDECPSRELRVQASHYFSRQFVVRSPVFRGNIYFSLSHLDFFRLSREWDKETEYYDCHPC